MDYNFNVQYPYPWPTSHAYIGNSFNNTPTGGQPNLAGGLQTVATTPPVIPPPPPPPGLAVQPSATPPAIPPPGLQVQPAAIPPNLHLTQPPVSQPTTVPGYGAGVFPFGINGNYSHIPPVPSQYGVSWNYGFNSSNSNAPLPRFNQPVPSQQLQHQHSIASTVTAGELMNSPPDRESKMDSGNVQTSSEKTSESSDNLSNEIAEKVTSLLSGHDVIKSAISRIKNSESLVPTASTESDMNSEIMDLGMLNLDGLQDTPLTPEVAVPSKKERNPTDQSIRKKNAKKRNVPTFDSSDDSWIPPKKAKKYFPPSQSETSINDVDPDDANTTVNITQKKRGRPRKKKKDQSSLTETSPSPKIHITSTGRIVKRPDKFQSGHTDADPRKLFKKPLKDKKDIPAQHKNDAGPDDDKQNDTSIGLSSTDVDYLQTQTDSVTLTDDAELPSDLQFPDTPKLVSEQVCAAKVVKSSNGEYSGVLQQNSVPPNSISNLLENNNFVQVSNQKSLGIVNVDGMASMELSWQLLYKWTWLQDDAKKHGNSEKTRTRGCGEISDKEKINTKTLTN